MSTNYNTHPKEEGATPEEKRPPNNFPAKICSAQKPVWTPPVGKKSDRLYLPVDVESLKANAAQLTNRIVTGHGDDVAPLVKIILEDVISNMFQKPNGGFCYIDADLGAVSSYNTIGSMVSAEVGRWFDLNMDAEDLSPIEKAQIIAGLTKRIGRGVEIEHVSREVTPKNEDGEVIEGATETIKEPHIKALGLPTVELGEVASLSLPRLVKAHGGATVYWNPTGGEKRRPLRSGVEYDLFFLDYMNGVLKTVFDWQEGPFESVDEMIGWFRWSYQDQDREDWSQAGWSLMWMARTLHQFGTNATGFMWLTGKGGSGKTSFIKWFGELMNHDLRHPALSMTTGQDLDRGWTDGLVNDKAAIVLLDDIEPRLYQDLLEALKGITGGTDVSVTTKRNIGDVRTELTASYVVVTNDLPTLDRGAGEWDRRICLIQGGAMTREDELAIKNRVTKILADPEPFLDQLNLFFFELGAGLDLSNASAAISTTAREAQYAASIDIVTEALLSDALNDVWPDGCYVTRQRLIDHLCADLLSGLDMTKLQVTNLVNDAIDRGLLIGPKFFNADAGDKIRLPGFAPTTIGKCDGKKGEQRKPLIRAPMQLRAAGGGRDAAWLDDYAPTQFADIVTYQADLGAELSSSRIDDLNKFAQKTWNKTRLRDVTALD